MPKHRPEYDHVLYLDHTLAIVFRNPHPQRTPMRAKLYLRGDGSSVHIDYPDEKEFDQAEPIAPRR